MDTALLKGIIRKIKGRARDFEVKFGDLVVRGGFSSQSGVPEVELPTEEKKTSEEDVVEVRAHRVGYFTYLRDRKGGVIVKPGTKVSKDDPVGLIVAMGVETRVVSPVEGVVDEILVKEGTPVEYGQPLMRIKPQ